MTYVQPSLVSHSSFNLKLQLKEIDSNLQQIEVLSRSDSINLSLVFHRHNDRQSKTSRLQVFSLKIKTIKPCTIYCVMDDQTFINIKKLQSLTGGQRIVVIVASQWIYSRPVIIFTDFLSFSEIF